MYQLKVVVEPKQVRQSTIQVNQVTIHLNSIHITESITLNDSNTDTDLANIVTGESMLTVDDNVTITVEEGKKVIPDLFNVFDTQKDLETMELQQVVESNFNKSTVVIVE